MCVSLILATTSLWADTTTSAQTPTTQAKESNGIISPYGQNPNIFHVFAYKTQEGVINTASRVGAATERGINKLKPKAKEAQEGIENTAQAAEKKLTETKNAVLGNPVEGPAPIVQEPLSQSGNNQTQLPQQAPVQTESGSSKTYAISDL